MNRLSPIGCLGWALFWASQFVALPAAASEADETFFETRIRPVLIQHCYPCHSHETGAAKGGLFLDTSAGVLRGGDSGPAIVPHHPAKSLLVQALRYDGLEMPPDGRLPDTLVRDLKRGSRTVRGIRGPARRAPRRNSRAAHRPPQTTGPFDRWKIVQSQGSVIRNGWQMRSMRSYSPALRKTGSSQLLPRIGTRFSAGCSSI